MHSICQALQCTRSRTDKSRVSHPGCLGIPDIVATMIVCRINIRATTRLNQVACVKMATKTNETLPHKISARQTLSKNTSRSRRRLCHRTTPAGE